MMKMFFLPVAFGWPAFFPDCPGLWGFLKSGSATRSLQRCRLDGFGWHGLIVGVLKSRGTSDASVPCHNSLPQAAVEEKATDVYTEGMQHYRHRRFSEVPWQRHDMILDHIIVYSYPWLSLICIYYLTCFFPKYTVITCNYIIFILAYSKNISIDSFRIHVHM